MFRDSSVNYNPKSWKKDTLMIIWPFNTLYRSTLNYRTYGLDNQSQVFNTSVARCISKMTRRVVVQQKSHIFYPTDPISILSFLSVLETTFDSNGIPKGTLMWLFQYLVKKITKAAISVGTTTVGKRRGKDGQLTSCDILVNCLLLTNSTDYIMAETDRSEKTVYLLPIMPNIFEWKI